MKHVHTSSQSFSGPFFILFAAVLWSFDALIRTSLYTLPPVLVSFWEHLLGLILIAPFFFPHWRKVTELTAKEWSAIGALAVFASTLGVVLYTYGLILVGFTAFSIVVLIQQTQPLWAILTASFLLKERISPMFILYVCGALVGVYLMVFPQMVPNLQTGTDTFIAGLCALGAALSWGSGTSLGKLVLTKVPHTVTAFLRFGLASIFSFLLFFIFAGMQSVTGSSQILGTSYMVQQFFSLTSDQWVSLILIVCITGATAFLIYYYGLRRTSARVATICELAWPASSLLIGILWFENTFTWSQIVGIVLLSTCMFFVVRMEK